jgi:hypothetical protein
MHQQQHQDICQQLQSQQNDFKRLLQSIRNKDQHIEIHSRASPTPASSSSSSSSSICLNSTPTAAVTSTKQGKIKQPGNISRILRSTVIQIIQNHLLSRSTMTFTSQDIEKRRKTEIRYQRHQTNRSSALNQDDDYIRATLVYIELKYLTRSLSSQIVTTHPGSTFPQLPQHIKTQLACTLNQQAATKHRLLIEKSEKNWLARYFFNSYFRSYRSEYMRRQK